jgi:hypothetical protein
MGFRGLFAPSLSVYVEPPWRPGVVFERRRVMEHIAAFMLLIACSNDLETCKEYPAPAVAYETVEQCRVDLTPALRTMSASQTKAFGKCVEIDPALFYEDVEIVWDVTRKGGIEVSIDVINPHMAVQSVARADIAASTNQETGSELN